jgi:hypothetical protein
VVEGRDLFPLVSPQESNTPATDSTETDVPTAVIDPVKELDLAWADEPVD